MADDNIFAVDYCYELLKLISRNLQLYKMKYFLIIFCTAFNFTLAQKIYQHEEKLVGQIFFTERIAIPVENAGYTLVLPDDNEADGLVVFLNSNRDAGKVVEEQSLEFYALQNNLGILFVTTGNKFEFFFSEDSIKKVDRYISEVIDSYNIPKQNLFFAGMSLSGTRALKYAQFCAEGKSEFGLFPAAVAVCDAPLDFVRFWKEADKAKRLNFNPITANEGEWVTGYLEKNLGGTPKEKLKSYQNFSVYCYIDDKGGNASLLKNIPVRAYTEPDVLWWMETRRKDYYAMNALDLAAMVNELNILGNENAELIITYDKGFKPDGTRHPHSWSIVDNEDLVKWFLTFFDKK